MDTEQLEGKKNFNADDPETSIKTQDDSDGQLPNKPESKREPKAPTEQADQSLPHSSDTIASSGKDLEPERDCQWVFLDVVPDFMKCPICSGVFESPQLLSCCGKSICKRCMERHLQRLAMLADQEPSCPFDRSTDYKLIHNTALEQSIFQLKVKCSYQHKGCGWVGVLQMGNLHLKECHFVPINCPNGCGCEQFERHKLSDHMLICPCTHTTCSFEAIGCDEKSLLLRQAAQKHANDYRNHHLLLVAQRNIKLLKDYKDLCTSLQSKSCVNIANDELIESQREALASTKCSIKSLRESLQEIRQKTASLKTDLKSEEICLQEMKRKVMKMKSTEATLRASADEVQILPIPISTGMSFPPDTIFTINNFRRRMQMNDMWLSPPFYTHLGGYKLCLSVFPASHKPNGTSVSVSIHLLAGEFDEHLVWPFPCAIFTITAVNQRSNKCNRSATLELDGEDTLFIRSRQIDGSLGYGLNAPDFLPHSDLSRFLSRDNCFKLMVYRIQFLPL